MEEESVCCFRKRRAPRADQGGFIQFQYGRVDRDFFEHCGVDEDPGGTYATPRH